MLLAVILFALTFLCGLAWFYLLQKEKPDDELLRDVKTQLDHISVNTSDQQLA